MRVLMLAQFYPKTIGGEERHVQDLGMHLAKRGHEVSVATIWHPGSLDFEMDNGVRVHRVHGTAQRVQRLYRETMRRHAPPFPDVELTMGLRKIIQRERPEIVHAHNWLVHSFLPLKVWSGAKLVMSLHDYSFVCAKKSMMQETQVCSGPELGKCLACAVRHYGAAKGVVTVLGTYGMGALERSLVDSFIAVSQATAQGNLLAEQHLPYQVIPNFVPEDYDGGENDESYLEQLPKGDFILFVGDLSARKGIDILLHAYEMLENAPPLVIIGRRLEESPKTFPPNVLVLDKWPHSAVMQAWRRSMFGLAPSVWPEPFGIVVLEAMAAGRPVIASRIGGLIDAIVDGESGLLVTPGDPNALRTAMAELLADPERREQMGIVGKRRAADFQANAIVPRIEQVYQKLLEPYVMPARGTLEDDTRTFPEKTSFGEKQVTRNEVITE